MEFTFNGKFSNLVSQPYLTCSFISVKFEMLTCWELQMLIVNSWHTAM